LTSGAHNLAFNAGANVFNAGDTSAKMAGLTTAVNEAITQMQELGVPADDIVTKVISVGMTEFLTNNADKMDAASFVAAMKGITIGDKTLNEIIPNYDFQMNQLYRQIKRQNYEDRALEYQNQQLTNKMNMEDANRDFFQWYKNNQNATNDEIQQMALSLIGQYDLDSEGLSFLNVVAGTRGKFTELKTNITDPATYNTLAAQAATGELTNQEIGEAILNGTLHPDDAFKLQGKMEKVEAQGNKEVQTTVKRILNDYTNKNGAYHKTTPPDVRNNINSTIAQIQSKVDNGEMTPSQAQAKLKQLERAIPSMLMEKQAQNKNYSVILQGNYRNSQYVPEISDMNKAKKAIINYGLLRNKQGVRDTNVQIISKQTNNRNGRKHFGNDFDGVYIGRPVYAPSNGEIISSGFESTMGNYAVFRDKRGKYLLLMHLRNTVPKGRVDRNIPIAYVGNTGRVENKNSGCLHVEFWDENLRLTTPDKW
jgi:murein DD-endopeptidase MepM/ murein hydrolase activator NlpD